MNAVFVLYSYKIGMMNKEEIAGTTYVASGIKFPKSITVMDKAANNPQSEILLEFE